MAKITFNNRNPLFFQSVKKSVDDYFKKEKIKKTGDWRLYVKTLILMPTALAIYVYLIFGKYGVASGILLAALLGFTLVCVAFNVMHDACHGSFSGKKWVNEVMEFTMNALGSTSYIWKIKHNIIHHTYTNIDGIDSDIAYSPLLRQCRTQKWLPVHRFQYIYMFFLYAISTLGWVLASDFVKYFSKRIHTTKINRISRKEHLVLWITKVVYAFFYIAVPVYFLGWQAWLTGFLVVHATMGLILSIVFQLAHVVEKTSFESAPANPRGVETEWAVHEILTTSDFAAQNKLVCWLLGGLNFQTEHHLFPQISHVHYLALSRIVRQQCRQFGLPYHYYPTMGEAIRSHVRLMKELGRGQSVHFHRPRPVET
jgi:linoleoyl-CoA desaturase